MATVLTAAADDGVSVLLSSHVLAELERVLAEHPAVREVAVAPRLDAHNIRRREPNRLMNSISSNAAAISAIFAFRLSAHNGDR